MILSAALWRWVRLSL